MTKFNVVRRAIKEAKKERDFLTEAEKAKLIELIEELGD